MAPKKTTILNALRDFAEAVATKSKQITVGEPEEQLRAPFEKIIEEGGRLLGCKVVCTGETKLPDRLGKPDFAIHVKKLLVGYVELKAPGKGANPNRFKGHDRDQWKRFKSIPNLLYCDGNEWILFRSGERVGKIVRLTGDILTDGRKAATTEDAYAIENLLRQFLAWEPFIPTSKGKIDLKEFAQLIAPICRMLRDDVTDALKDGNSSLRRLAGDWRQLLFPEATDDQFADAFAQTVAFALLLGRAEGAEPLNLETAEKALAAQHNLLSRALQVLTDQAIRKEVEAPLELLQRVIAAVPATTLSGPDDPWLYFYEDFLAAYDPKLRKDAGAYYTPIEVVRAQVRLIDDLLVNRMNRPLGFADPEVVTLDPAAGTGTYLLGVIEHALSRIEAVEGVGAVAGRATTLAKNLYGFEIMVGPYAVTELRTSRALRDRGATLPKDGTNIYLTDTLESPNAEPPQLPLFLQPIAEQHAKALKVKSKVPVIVCLGNPPYDRHEAFPRNTEQQLSKWGGWVRFSDPLADRDARLAKRGKKKVSKKKSELSLEQALDLREKSSILYSGFIKSAKDAGYGVHIKNLYNLYVYFWRWALWKVFEHETSSGPGIASFITASSYLDGDAFCGMREKMRRECDEVWILDLGGEGRGTRQSDNVFAIKTPVAIAVAFRSGRARKSKPAKVHYAKVEGKRDDKLATLSAITDFTTVKWKKCPANWQAPFRPTQTGGYFEWPLMTDLMPWQPTGVMAGRTWVIGPLQSCLEARWRRLVQTAIDKRAALFIENATGRKITDKALSLYSPRCKLKEIYSLSSDTPCPEIGSFGFRFLDTQYLLADGRLIDRPCPDLWSTDSEKQTYLSSLLSHPLGVGSALASFANIPDKHAFRGSYGGKNVFPLFRNSEATEPNILTGLLELLTKTYKRKVTPEDFLAYVYGVLAQPAFTERFNEELETRELRVPITRDKALFEEVREHGARLLWLHTYGERFVPKGKRRGQVPKGKAKCVKAVPESKDRYPEDFKYNDETRTLRVGEGEFRPVAPEVFTFEVSGLKVVQSWLKYRMKKGAGKKSSPLDDIRPEHWTSQFTTELLELLWVLEETTAGYPEQAKLLEAVIDGPCFQKEELPEVPEVMRKPPKAKSKSRDMFD